MLCKIKDEPFNSDEWLFEIKWDGYRAIAEVNRGEVNMYSRNNLSFTEKFAPVSKALGKLNHAAVFDGEIVVHDDDGKPSFQAIQQYETSRDPISYYIYDLLYLDGYDLTKVPLVRRKEMLQQLIPGDDPVLKYSDHIIGEGIFLYREMKKNRMEGIIAKEINSVYRRGFRSSEWLKIKTVMMQEAVIAGFTAPRGGRKEIGALVLGVYENGVLKYAGHTGGGFNEQALKDMHKRLEPLIQDKSPFHEKVKTNSPATWVKPVLVCEVAFSEWTEDGHMRHPVFQGMREDKKAKDVVREKEDKQAAKKVETHIAMEKEKDAKVVIGKHRLSLTNLKKVYWPDEGYTKGDVINYYRAVSNYILPYLKDRPQSLHRHPNGIYEESFYQKDAGGKAPRWVKTCRVQSESEDKYIDYIVCQEEATLIYMNNLGCIEVNPWNSRTRSKTKPDYIVIDLDPSEGNTFEQVIDTTLVVGEVLKKAGAEGFCKTSGATGMHIYIPLGARYDYDQAMEFARILAFLTHEMLPDVTTVERSLKSRGDKIYVDFLQNRIGQTLACAYSLRPKPGATVSTPLDWKEVKPGIHPSHFNLKNTLKRLEKKGDIFLPVLGKGIDIKKCLHNLGG